MSASTLQHEVELSELERLQQREAEINERRAAIPGEIEEAEQEYREAMRSFARRARIAVGGEHPLAMRDRKVAALEAERRETEAELEAVSSERAIEERAEKERQRELWLSETEALVEADYASTRLLAKRFNAYLDAYAAHVEAARALEAHRVTAPDMDARAAALPRVEPEPATALTWFARAYDLATTLEKRDSSVFADYKSVLPELIPFRGSELEQTLALDGVETAYDWRDVNVAQERAS